MLWLLLILFPFLLADIINPVLFAGVVYSLGTHRPYLNASGVIGSFFLAYFLVGVVLIIGIEWFEGIYYTVMIDYTIEFLIALLLLFMAWKMRKNKDQHPEKRLETPVSMHFREACLLGFHINVIGLPFIVPYLAAINQLLKADLHPLQVFSALFVYNILYVLPYMLLIWIRWGYKRESDRIFHKIHRWFDFVIEKYLSTIFVILALLLLEDCISYFLGYREYSFLSII